MRTPADDQEKLMGDATPTRMHPRARLWRPSPLSPLLRDPRARKPRSRARVDQPPATGPISGVGGRRETG